MKPKCDFIRLDNIPNLDDVFHKWEVFMPRFEGKYRIEKFAEEEYETPQEQYEAVMDLIRGCRFSDTEYHVFCDDILVVDL